jgi:tRNA nucleotidyltransferase (CCA-adding enzyme)
LQVVILQNGADLDELSSAYAITLLNPDFKILLPNSYELKVKKTLDVFSEKFKDKIIKINQLDISKITKAIITDHQLLDITLPENVEVEIYDHHPKKAYSKKYKTHLYKTGALTTIFVEKLKREKIKIDSIDATILALGIYEDTGGFKYKGTTLRDIKAYQFLFEVGIDLNRFMKVIQDRFDLPELELLKELQVNAEFLPIKDFKIYISQTSKRYNYDVAGLLKYVKAFEDADAYFVVINQKNKKTIIGRSADENIDVNKILKHFDGGGHKYAASAQITGFSYEDIKTILIYLLEKEPFNLEHLIIDDLPKIKFDTKFKELENLVKTYKYMIVLDQNGKYAGILSSQTVKLGLKHGLTEEKAITFAEDWYVVNCSDLNILKLKKLMEINSEIFPVIKEGQYIGVIYKKDIIKQLLKDIPEENLTHYHLKTYNFKQKLEKFFPKILIEKFKEIGELSQKLGYRSFIIGGVVRDIILNRPNLDVDIIVEGDAPTLIKEYVKDKNYTFYIYNEFMTGQVMIENGLKLDFSTARKEEYQSPGAYPKVEKATLFEDLYRRDFTINTLAIEITSSNYGILIDYFNAIKDIKEKRIRILHSLSFVEDPIRILRALRFAGRFNFKLEKNTEKLLTYSVEKGLLSVAPKGRINLELNLAFEEEKAIEILKLYDKYKVLNKIFTQTHIDSKKEILLQKLTDNLVLLQHLKPYNYSKTTNFLYVLLSHLPTELIYENLRLYHFDKEAKLCDKFVQDFNEILKLEDIFQIYKILKKINLEYLPAILTLVDEDRYKKIIKIFEVEKKPLIKGEDLIELGLKPSKLFKDILEDVFEKQLKEVFKNKDDAIKYIKSKYLERII